MTELLDDVTQPAGDDDGPRRRRIAPLIVGVVAIVMVGLIVVLAGADPDRSESADSPLIGRPAPEATGTLDDGTSFDLARRKGSWVVLNFFDPECVPCIQEHPELVQFSEDQASLGVEGAELYSVITRVSGARSTRSSTRTVATGRRSTRSSTSSPWRSGSRRCPRRGSSIRVVWCSCA